MRFSCSSSKAIKCTDWILKSSQFTIITNRAAQLLSAESSAVWLLSRRTSSQFELRRQTPSLDYTLKLFSLIKVA